MPRVFKDACYRKKVGNYLIQLQNNSNHEIHKIHEKQSMIGNSVLVYFVYLVVLQLSLSILSPVHGAAGGFLLGMRVLVVQHLLFLSA